MGDIFRMDPSEVQSISGSIASLKEELSSEYASLQGFKNSLNEHWNGDTGSVAAQAALDEVLSLYNSMISTVQSTSDSLRSAADGTVSTDESNARMFKNF